jgi:hypothetical protein
LSNNQQKSKKFDEDTEPEDEDELLKETILTQTSSINETLSTDESETPNEISTIEKTKVYQFSVY